jgi:hypothetical protein
VIVEHPVSVNARSLVEVHVSALLASEVKIVDLLHPHLLLLLGSPLVVLVSELQLGIRISFIAEP